MRRLIDSFPFFNELDMLLLRLTELDHVVDTFILVESTATFSGNPKPLYFAENKQVFERFLHKIVHIVYDDLPPGKEVSMWTREDEQRNAIARAFPKLNLQLDDLFVLSDVDEIPDTEVLSRLKTEGLPGGIHSLQQDLYYYNVTCKSPEPWTYAKIMEVRNIVDLKAVRSAVCPTIARGGWHLSYFGSPEFVRTKIKSFAHDELNTEHFTDIDRIERMMKGGKDLYERDYVRWLHIPLGTNTYLPKNISIVQPIA